MGIFDSLLSPGAFDGPPVAADTYFPALRSEVMKTLADCDPDDRLSRDRASLMFGLYFVFFGRHPEAQPSQRRRFCEAIFHLCRFLHDQDFPPMLVHEILQLGDGLQELDKGVVPSFLEIRRPAGSPADPGNVWFCRALVAMALDFAVVVEGKKKGAAAAQIAERYAPLCAVLAKTAKTFEGAIKKWHRDFSARTIESVTAQVAFDQRAEHFAQCKKAGFADGFVVDKILVDAMLLATRIDDDAMRTLYKEVERRSRLKRPY